ncbi:MAG TPA: 1-acyl-sn-glycerol-3-phosphate acyltransferase, partial [Gemmatimonadaceae bacterium]|nr:1-acyl-sn-glycerol-3-phosphate acyltransferase [Gemmatimonadaceae bacterium]
MPVISRLACRAYYRLTVGGGRVAPDGPALIVANHTNSLMDPALVVVAARRKVRFMAKSTLFTHRAIGWLVRAVGSVPVYRRQDDPKAVSQNYDSFRDVSAALAQGYAVGIFPEGISHSASRLQPLKTGAARIALGAALKSGAAFPIVPVGLVFRDRRSFRSAAHIVIGDGFAWDDIATRGPNDKEAVRELTRRIDVSLRRVTLNLHDWSDEQLVRCAERVWRAEFEVPGDARDEMLRLRAATTALSRLRLGEDSGWRRVARALRAHDRMLTRMGLTPRALKERVSGDAALRWTLSRIPQIAFVPLAAIGWALCWIPREVTGALAEKLAKPEGEDAVPTYRVLVGFLFFLAWFGALGAASSFALGAWGGLAVFLALPFVAFGALAVGESQRATWEAVRRFFVLRLQRKRVAALR